ncbi:MAG: hypothetical protein ACM34A_12165 [Bacillota bacterium]
MFVEFPKSLYLNGNREGDHAIVHGVEEEAGKRAEGYRMLGEPQKENEPQKRTRKAKQ